MSPMAFHRWRYEQHVEMCRGARLESFAPTRTDGDATVQHASR
jgi:hypothetical protein